VLLAKIGIMELDVIDCVVIPKLKEVATGGEPFR
jgi:hypothetical protein